MINPVRKLYLPKNLFQKLKSRLCFTVTCSQSLRARSKNEKVASVRVKRVKADEKK